MENNNEDLHNIFLSEMQQTIELVTNWESMRENWIQQLTTTKKDHEVLVIESSKENTYSAEAIECMSKNKEACLNDIHHYMGKVETADKVSVCQKHSKLLHFSFL